MDTDVMGPHGDILAALPELVQPPGDRTQDTQARLPADIAAAQDFLGYRHDDGIPIRLTGTIRIGPALIDAIRFHWRCRR